MMYQKKRTHDGCFYHFAYSHLHGLREALKAAYRKYVTIHGIYDRGIATAP